MQSGIKKDVEFSELSAVDAVELRVHDDSANSSTEAHSSGAANAEDEIVEPVAVNESSASSDMTVASENGENATMTAGTNYHDFSNKFGHTTHSSSVGFSPVWEHYIKQQFNFAYFSLSAISIAFFTMSMKWPVLWMVVAIFTIFSLAAFKAAWNRRMHPNDFAVIFSTRTKAIIRATALIVPVPFIAWMVVAQPLSYMQLAQGQDLFHDGNYQDAIKHFNRAAMLNPGLERAYTELADCYNYTFDYSRSIENADKALRLDPRDGSAWASKAWALNALDKFSEALPTALNAVQFYPESGEAYHALADAYVGLGDYEKALQPATRHARIHDAEPEALYLKAKILEKLKRADEAAQDRAEADALGKQDNE